MLSTRGTTPYLWVAICAVFGALNFLLDAAKDPMPYIVAAMAFGLAGVMAFIAHRQAKKIAILGHQIATHTPHTSA